MRSQQSLLSLNVYSRHSKEPNLCFHVASEILYVFISMTTLEHFLPTSLGQIYSSHMVEVGTYSLLLCRNDTKKLDETIEKVTSFLDLF